MKKVIATILSSAFVFAASFEPLNNYLAIRWTKDPASVTRDVYRVKTVLTYDNTGKQVISYYAVKENLRAINQYTICVMSPELCKTESPR